jgi:hypothetical protein
MANRNAVKGAIVTKNVPTVTNAILTDMLNSEMNDNIRFREDYATPITVTTADPITGVVLDFTGIDRIDLTRTGGNTVLSVSGMGDGEEKYLRFTKSAGSTVAWTGVTDITGDQTNVTAAGVVVYQIIRKGTTYLAQAFVTPVTASPTAIGVTRFADSSEITAGTETALAVSPYTLTLGVPNATQTTAGRVELATTTEIANGTDLNGVKALVVKPSQLKTTNDRILELEDRYLAKLTGYTVPNAGTVLVTVTHNRNTTAYVVSAIPVTSSALIFATVETRNANTCTIRLWNTGGVSVVADLDVMVITT